MSIMSIVGEQLIADVDTVLLPMLTQARVGGVRRKRTYLGAQSLLVRSP